MLGRGVQNCLKLGSLLAECIFPLHWVMGDTTTKLGPLAQWEALPLAPQEILKSTKEILETAIFRFFNTK